MYDVSGQTVFITGGAQGLGRAYGEAVLEKGAKLFFGDLDKTAGEETEKELKAKFGVDKVHFCLFDVTDRSKFEEAFKEAVSKFGCVDVMVNNAGVLNEGIWELMIQINFTSIVHGTKMALEHMRTDKGGKGGRIINISSIVGLIDHYSQPVYVGTKQAVRSFTSSIAMQPEFVESTGVALAVLCPDATGTDLMFKLDDSRMMDYEAKLKDQLAARMAEVPTITAAFMKLLQLGEMNGAILLATKDSANFMKMSMQPLGPEYPPPPPPAE